MTRTRRVVIEFASLAIVVGVIAALIYGIRIHGTVKVTP